MALKSARTIQYDFIADISDIKLKLEKLQGQVSGMANKMSNSMAKTQTDMQKAFTTLNVRPFDKIKADIREVQAAYTRLASSGQASSQQLALASSAASSKIKMLKAEMLGAGKQAGFLAMKIKTLGFIIGTMAFTFFTKETFRQFGEFDQRIRDIWTLTDETESRMKNVGDTILNMTKTLPETATGLAKGLYDIVSAGISLEDSFYVLEQASKAAVAGLSDTQTSARIGVQILNAYGLEVEEIGHVYDSLFNLVKRGVTTFPQIAQYIGSIIPVAASSGVSLNELTAALAILTKTGFNMSKAVTGMRFGMLSLIKPTEKTAEVMRLAGIKWEGELIPTLMRLKELGFDTAEALGKLGFPARSMAQMINLVRYAEDVNTTFLEFQERVGIMEEAASKQINSFKNQIQIAVNGIRAAATQIGEDMAPIVGAIVGFVGDMARNFSELPGPVREATYAITAFALTLKSISIIFGAGAIPAGIAALISSLETLTLVLMGAGTALQTSLAVAIPVVGALLVGLGVQVKNFHDDWEETWSQINFDDIISKTQGYQDFTLESLNTIRGYSDLMVTAYTGAVEKKIQYLRATISKMEKESSSTVGKIVNNFKWVASQITKLIGFVPFIGKSIQQKLQEFILGSEIKQLELEIQLNLAEKSWDDSMDELRKRAEGVAVQIETKAEGPMTEKEIVQQRLALKDLNDALDQQRQKLEAIQTQQLKTIFRLTGQKISIDDINSLLAEQMSASEILIELQKQKGLLNKKDNQTAEENLQINEQVAKAISLIYSKYQDLLKVDKDIALATAAFEDNVKGTTEAVGDAAIAANDLAKAMGTKMEEASGKMSKSVSSNATKAKKAIDKNLTGAIEIFKNTAGNITLDIGGGKTAEVSIKQLGNTLAESLKGGAIKGAADLKKIMLDTAEQTTVFTKVGKQWKPIDVSNILDAGSALAKLTNDQQQAWFEIQTQLTDYHRTLSDGTAVEEEKRRWKELAEEILGTKTELQKTFASIKDIGFVLKGDELAAITEAGKISLEVEPGKAEEIFNMLSDASDEVKQKWLEVNAGFSFGLQQLQQYPQEMETLVQFMKQFGISGEDARKVLQENSTSQEQLDEFMRLAGEKLDLNVTKNQELQSIEQVRLSNMRTMLDLLSQYNQQMLAQSSIPMFDEQMANIRSIGVKKFMELMGQVQEGTFAPGEMMDPLADLPAFDLAETFNLDTVKAGLDGVKQKISDMGMTATEVRDEVNVASGLISTDINTMLLAIDGEVQAGTGFGHLKDVATQALDTTTAKTKTLSETLTSVLIKDEANTQTWGENKQITFTQTFDNILTHARSFSSELLGMIGAAENNLRTLKSIKNEAARLTPYFGAGFATGGLVGGPGGIDNVPAWLTSGEYVIRKEAVRKWGTGFLSMLNNGVGSLLPKMLGKGGRMRFAAGGMVPGISTNSQPVNIGGTQTTLKNVNVVDPSLMEKVLTSDTMENVILNIIKDNSATVMEFLS